MKRGSGLFREEITDGVTRLIAAQWLFTLFILLVATVAGGYYLLQTELNYKKSIITTRISTEISTLAGSLDALTQSPVLWTALTDTTDQNAYLTPLLESLNRSEVFKVLILDYKGREIVRPAERLIEKHHYQSFIDRRAGKRNLSFTVFEVDGRDDFVGVLFPIVSPLSDTVVGHALSTYSVAGSLAKLQLLDDTVVRVSFKSLKSELDKPAWQFRGLFTIATIARGIVTTPNGDFEFCVEVTESYREAVLWFLTVLVTILLGGLVALRSGRRWAAGVTGRTLARFEQLLDVSRQVVQGKTTVPLTDDRGDEISEIRNTLAKLLTDQRQTLEQLKTSASVFMTAGEAIMITSINGEILDVNPALLEITGYERSDLIGNQAGKLYRSGLRSAPDAAIKKALEQRGYWRGETVFFDVNDTVIPVQLAVTRVSTDSLQEHRQVAVFTDIREIKDAEEQLRRFAYQDVLTELPNYRAFSELMSVRLSAENATEHPFLLIFIDLDRLKQINDLFGHERGDKVIKDVADHISDVLPPGHRLYRRSGDEFLAIVDFKDETELADIKRQLDRRLSSHSIAIDMETFHTTISAGVTIFPTFSRSLPVLLQQADAALYESKRDLLRKRVVWYTDAMGDKISRRLRIETSLERAIVSGAIVAHYQPEVEMPSGKVIGFEALARWEDPELGRVAPDEFITVAEENGLIVMLTESIAAQVLDALPQIRSHTKNATVSLNVAPQLFLGRKITELLIGLMDERHTDLDGLVVEVTESELTQNLGAITSQLNTIRGLGVKVAIDDFGKGHSSLSRLTDMPLDKLKIDLSFVSGSGGKVQKDIIKLIMTLSRQLNLEVTAEGVETEDQMQELVDLGCYRAQGWYYKKAIPLEQVLKLPSHL